MNRHTTAERCHEPMILILTRCHLEELDRELACYSHAQLVPAGRGSHGATAFRRLARACWRTLHARVMTTVQETSTPAATTEQPPRSSGTKTRPSSA